MTDYNKIKADAVLHAAYNKKMKEYVKNKYHTDPVYREKMKEKARMRKAMLRGLNNINNPPLQESGV